MLKSLTLDKFVSLNIFEIVKHQQIRRNKISLVFNFIKRTTTMLLSKIISKYKIYIILKSKEALYVQLYIHI